MPARLLSYICGLSGRAVCEGVMIQALGSIWNKILPVPFSIYMT